MQEQVLPLEMDEAPQVTANLAAADPNHWNILNDPIYPGCLELFRERHEASTALEAATPVRVGGSRGRILLLSRSFPP